MFYDIERRCLTYPQDAEERSQKRLNLNLNIISVSFWPYIYLILAISLWIYRARKSYLRKVQKLDAEDFPKVMSVNNVGPFVSTTTVITPNYSHLMSDYSFSTFFSHKSCDIPLHKFILRTRFHCNKISYFQISMDWSLLVNGHFRKTAIDFESLKLFKNNRTWKRTVFQLFKFISGFYGTVQNDIYKT